MTEQELHFPVLSIKNQSVRVCANSNDLTACSSLALRQRWHDGMEIFQADGRRFRVRGASAGRTSATGALINRLFNRHINVTLEVDPQGSVGLEDLKALVLESLRKRPGQVDDSKKLEVANAVSMGELLDVIGAQRRAT